MNYALSEKSSPLMASNCRLERSLSARMKALQARLDNFTVLDRYGVPVGDVRNLVLYQQQLSLVIVQPDLQKHWRFVLLSCHLIDRISLRDRVVQIRTTQADMSYLPEYGVNHDSASHTTAYKEQPQSVVPLTTAPKTTKPSPLVDAPATPKVLASVMNTAEPESTPLSHQPNDFSSSGGSSPVASPEDAGSLQNGQSIKTQPEKSS